MAIGDGCRFYHIGKPSNLKICKANGWAYPTICVKFCHIGQRYRWVIPFSPKQPEVTHRASGFRLGTRSGRRMFLLGYRVYKHNKPHEFAVFKHRIHNWTIKSTFPGENKRKSMNIRQTYYANINSIRNQLLLQCFFLGFNFWLPPLFCRSVIFGSAFSDATAGRVFSTLKGLRGSQGFLRHLQPWKLLDWPVVSQEGHLQYLRWQLDYVVIRDE